MYGTIVTFAVRQVRKIYFLRHTKVTVKLNLNVLSDILAKLPSLMTIITLFLHNFRILFSYFGFCGLLRA